MIDVFPSFDGVRLRVRVVGTEAHEVPPPPPPPGSARSDKKDDGSEGGQNPSGGTDAHFTQPKWDGMEPEVRDLFKSNAPVGPAQKEAAAGDAQGKATIMGTLISGVCSNMSTRPLSPTFSSIEDLPLSPPRPNVAPASKKKKTSVRKFSSRSRVSSGSKQSMAGLCGRLDADMGSTSGSGHLLASPVARSPSIRSPNSTARKGHRVRDSWELVSVRAEHHAAARDLSPRISGSFHSAFF